MINFSILLTKVVSPFYVWRDCFLHLSVVDVEGEAMIVRRVAEEAIWEVTDTFMGFTDALCLGASSPLPSYYFLSVSYLVYVLCLLFIVCERDVCTTFLTPGVHTIYGELKALSHQYIWQSKSGFGFLGHHFLHNGGDSDPMVCQCSFGLFGLNPSTLFIESIDLLANERPINHVVSIIWFLPDQC